MSTYSYSKLSTFKSCPLKYKYQYIDLIKPEEKFEGIEAFMGKRVHEVLEKLYKDLRLRKLNTLEECLDYYDVVWKKNWSDIVRIVNQNFTEENYYNTGIDCIKNYYQRYCPFNQGVTLGTEMNLRGSLDSNSRYQINGYIDRLDQVPDGAYEIHDYKTSASLPDQVLIDEDQQLALYHLILPNKFNDASNVELVWHYLSFDKEFRSSRTNEQLEGLKNELMELINKIESTTEWEAIESKLCDWCDYPDICPKKKHFYKVQSLPANEYLNDDGVQLVNKYVELDIKKKEIESEISKLREAVVAYAKLENLQVIEGSDHALKVKISQAVKWPTKQEKYREELDKLILSSGHWNEVSDLNGYKLTKVLSAGRWDKSLTESLEKYKKIEESAYISLSKSNKEAD
ncbi:MAG: PD-(D/E)XK nuclease family protein [Actinobacteria bacterium]|nr:PD-(D/E)XK nuclease family protein [Actinomycetota bacterium]